MPTGGRLTLSTRALEGQLVQVRVADTGVGIPKEMQARIFEPFFTQKHEWQAKGMGLTIVNRIMEAHHGEVSVSSEVGKGSTFIVTLPVAQARTLL